MKPSTFSSDRVEAMSRSIMLRIFQLICAVMMLGASARPAFGFALSGPKTTWQADNIGYDRVTDIPYPSGGWNIFNTPEWTYAPHQIYQGYRWNIPNLYYAYDASFRKYFGTRGVQEVDSAVSILNALPPASQLDINDYPLDEARFNYTAAALHLYDLKSAALEALILRMGITDPERFAWTLRNRILIPGSQCPFYDYTVIQRNFDPDTLAPSRYVNGNLFTYAIQQLCPPGLPDRSEALEILVDPIDTYQTALASPKITWNNLSAYGLFHIGLTRDDVAGLKHLYHTNNMNEEISAPDVQLFNTNNTLALLFTSNLTVFAQQALTNNAAALQALYPNLVIASSTIIGFSNLFVTNIVGFLTNQPWAPAGTFQIAFTTNVVPLGVQPLFQHTFANVVTFQLIGGQFTAIPLTTVSQVNGVQIIANQIANVVLTNAPWSPAGTNTIVATNITTRLRVLTGPVGEFAVLPTNFCDVSIVSALLTNVTPETNIIASFTNVLAGTNPVSGQVLQTTLSVVDFFTNHIFAIFPISCTFSNVAERQGIDKVSFVRRDFDPVLSRFFNPITNDFDVVSETTNNIRYVEHFRRIVTRPDIIFAAGDGNLTTAPQVETIDHFSAATAPNFNGSLIPANPVPPEGPGTMEGPGGGPIFITFNQTGPTYFNSATGFIDENSAIFYYQWATFDGSTNAPILYPDAASLAALEQQSFMQISPSFMPAGAFGQPFSVTLSVTGGSGSYTWQLSPLSNPLPPGLNLQQDPGDSSQATISGTPGVPGNYTFIVRVTDNNGGLYVDTPYVVTIAQP
jgi:hypothetical protein